MAEVVQNHVAADQAAADAVRALTLEEYLEACADTELTVEIVEGEIVVMTPPDFAHVSIAHHLFRSMDRFAEENRLGQVFMETPYVLDADERRDWVRGSRVPDVSFIAQERLDAYLAAHGKQGPLRLAPDLAVEIISPTDRYTYITAKLTDYLRFGVRLVWLIDPKNRNVRVCMPDDPNGRTLHEADTLTGNPALPGWLMLVKEALDGGPTTAEQ